MIAKSKVDYVDIATNQAFSIATSMIPFLDHNDANRALMGSNMQKQATPCVEPEAPLVATGIEGPAMKDTGRLSSSPHLTSRRLRSCGPIRVPLHEL